MKLLTDLPYATEHPRQKLDLFLPAGAGPFACVVCLHGGGWLKGDKAGIQVYSRLLADAGFAAISANYRFASDAPHPAQEQDLFRVLDWIAREGTAFGLDPVRVGFSGSSAGAHLSALVALKATRPGTPVARCRVRAVLPVCGVFDIAAWVREVPKYAPNAEAIAGGPLDQKAAALRDASPCAHVHRDAPPFLLVHGDKDAGVPPGQSLRFAEALAAAGVEARCELVAGAGHTGTQPGDASQPLGGSRLFLDFFRSRLGPR
jgi:acetyl esterase/lipase